MIRRTVASVLKGGEHLQLEDDTDLFSVGLDSSTAAFLRGQLSALVGMSLPGSVTFDRPTIAGLNQAFVELAPLEAAPVATEEPFENGLRARRAQAEDWPALQALWR